MALIFLRSSKEAVMVKGKWQTSSITKLIGEDVEARHNFIEDNARM